MAQFGDMGVTQIAGHELGTISATIEKGLINSNFLLKIIGRVPVLFGHFD